MAVTYRSTESVLEQLSKSLGRKLDELSCTISCAESCTGGLAAAAITQISGSSSWFHEGFVTYSNQAKHRRLGVDLTLLEKYGAVSVQVANAMALGALKSAESDYALAITGIAGPGGGTSDKPVGTVCFAWAQKNGLVDAKCLHFDGDRSAVRQKSTEQALRGMMGFIKKNLNKS